MGEQHVGKKQVRAICLRRSIAAISGTGVKDEPAYYLEAVGASVQSTLGYPKIAYFMLTQCLHVTISVAV